MAENQIASFAAGCFWGVEARFRELDGVLDAVSGYMGGTTENPSYREVCSGDTGHAETVQVSFDPDTVSYQTLLDEFFEMHNPTMLNRQGPDCGTQYRSAIFFHDEAQESAADPIVTQVAPASEFWRAEEYHQRYFEKNGSAHCAI
jgi:peptide-methionine (S)-S-oxide reductase